MANLLRATWRLLVDLNDGWLFVYDSRPSLHRG
jgi:hypothetical protein